MTELLSSGISKEVVIQLIAGLMDRIEALERQTGNYRSDSDERGRTPDDR